MAVSDFIFPLEEKVQTTTGEHTNSPINIMLVESISRRVVDERGTPVLFIDFMIDNKPRSWAFIIELDRDTEYQRVLDVMEAKKS